MLGCSGGGTGGSKLNNQYLGTIPAIHADYNTQKAILDEKKQKMKDVNDYLKYHNEHDNALQKATEKLLAEAAKITEKPIPILFSDKFNESGNLFFTVKSAVIPSIENTKATIKHDGLEIKMVILSNDDVKISNQQWVKYELHYRLVTTDGTTLRKGKSLPSNNQFKAGDSMMEPSIHLSIMNNPELWADFAGVEFITKEEFDAIPIY